MKQLTQKIRDGNMEVLEVPVPDLKPGMLLIRNLYSLISAGTEGGKVTTARKGYIGKAKEKPQQVKQVVDTLRSQGAVQTYRAVMKKLDAYSPLGYSCVGEVIAVGDKNAGMLGCWDAGMQEEAQSSKLKAHRTNYGDAGTEKDVDGWMNRMNGGGTSEFRIGDIVACGGEAACHAEMVAVPRNLCVDLSPQYHLPKLRGRQSPQSTQRNEKHLQMAAYNTLGAIALQGVRQADLRLGESCAVIGMGLLGQLSAVFLKASGVRVVGIDIEAAAVALGREHCLDLGIERNDPGIVSKVGEFTGGIGCDGVIITAASSSLDPINFAGEISRKRGVVVVVGAVPTGFDRDPHFYRKELTVKMSCSYGPGRYDSEYEEKGRDYPVGYVRWTEKRNMEAFQALVAEGKIDIGYLTTHVFKLEDAPQAYDMIVGKVEPYLGILIQYDPQITLKEKDKSATDTRRQTQTLQEDVSRKGAKAQRNELAADERRWTQIEQKEKDSSSDNDYGAQRIGGQTQTKIITKVQIEKLSSVSIGFIGAGSYAQSYLLPNIPKEKDVVLKGVMTSTSTSSRSVADRYGFEFCTGNADDILGDDGINTVFIATRHDSHGCYVRKALEAGKHVFVEKPLCLTSEELEEIKLAADRRRLTQTEKCASRKDAKTQSGSTNSDPRPLTSDIRQLMVGYNRRFSPLTKIIKERLNQGPYSMLYRINAGMIPADSWMQDVEVGGGRILGEVCHFVDYLTYLSGSLPVSVFAVAMADAHHHEDTLTVSLRYENGSVGSIQYFANGSKALSKEYVEVYAHGVTAVLDDYRELKIYGKGKPYKKKLVSQDKGQKNEVRLFLEAIKEGRESWISVREIWSASEVCIGILDSLRTGEAVKVVS